MRTLTPPSEASAMPLTKQDCQALDEMFNDVDLQELSCLEAFFKGAFVPPLDPLEKPAWMADSSSSIMGNFIDCGY